MMCLGLLDQLQRREVSANLKSIRQLIYEQFNTFFAIFLSAKRLPELLLDTEPNN